MNNTDYFCMFCKFKTTDSEKSNAHESECEIKNKLSKKEQEEFIAWFRQENRCEEHG